MINRIKFLRNVKQAFGKNTFLCENIPVQSSNDRNLKYLFQNHRFYSNKRVRSEPIPVDYFDDKAAQTIDWDIVKNDLLTNFSWKLKNENIDYQILAHLCYKNYWDLGMKYIDLLKSKDINVGTQLGIINFMYKYNNVKPLNSQEKSYIIDRCNKIIKEHKLLSVTVCTSCVEGYSITEEWKKCFELIDRLKEITIPTMYLYSLTASTAFKNGNADLGWKFLQEMVENNKEPSEHVCTDWINFCITKYKDKNEMLESVEKYLYFSSINNLKFNLETVTHISNTFTNYFDWNTSFVKIGKNGKCNHCKSSLPKLKVTDEECIELKESLLKNVMVGKSVFSKSTPKEINNFLTFINESGPFDIVIDGLNVVYSRPNMIDLKILVNVIDHFKILNKKILVIGRNQFKKWHARPDFEFIRKNSSTFYTDDLSYDDTFLLYACLFYPGTKFVSRDLMRGHKFLLQNDRLQNIFKKWQASHQYLLSYSDEKKKKVFFKTPTEYLSCVTKNISWHIPYDTNSYGEVRKETFEFPNDWLCLKPK